MPQRLSKKKAKADGDLPSLRDVEQNHIRRILGATGWNKAKAARILGIPKPTFYGKIRVYERAPDANL